MVVFCERGKKSLFFLKFGELLDQLSNYELLMKDSLPWSE